MTMETKKYIRERRDYWVGVYEKLQKAYVALIEGGVKSYAIDDRNLTRFDLDTLREEMEYAEDMIDQYDGELEGKKPRKAFGVLPRDW